MKRISVLGLGESLNQFSTFDEPSIGVNDVYKYHPVEYLVCVDRPTRFNNDRLATIKNSTPVKLFSQLDDWKDHNAFEKIVISPFKGQLSWSSVGHSNNSPFVACVIAYLLGFQEIVLYGVDFVSHQQLSAQNHIKRLLSDYEKLNQALQKKGAGLYSGSDISILNQVIPKYKN